VTPRSGAASAVVPALPLAALAVLWLARWLPLRFEYRENDLGIVSFATLERYPQQQETFWLVFGVGTAAVLAWGLSRALARPLGAARQIAVEAAAVGALLAALWLPAAAGTGLGLALGFAALVLARRGASAPESASPAPVAFEPHRHRLPQLLALAAASLSVAALVTPALWLSAWALATGLPDAQRALDGFPFQGEIGQHLAWVNALSHGRLHGRDFFCLYAPLYDWGAVAAWKLFGRSIVAWDLYFSVTRVLGLAGALALVAALARQRALALAVPFFAPWINLRTALPLYAIGCLYAWLRGGRSAWAGAAGVVTGVSLLFSQEFGLAGLLCGALALALRAEARAAAAFAAGLALVVAPVLVGYAAGGALLPMLRDVASYPAWVIAGYAKLPFPALAAEIPLSPAALGSRELLLLQLGYALPAVCLAALLLALPIARLDPRRLVATAGEIVRGLRIDPQRTAVALLAVYGLLSFRSALGRSDLKHAIDALPAAALLVVLGFDAAISRWRSGAWPMSLAAWRAAALAVLVLHAGLTAAPAPVRATRKTLDTLASLPSHRPGGAGSPQVLAVARWISQHTEPGEPVLFLPNNAAYYYLTDRPNPIRFVMGHQIVTQAHRVEVLAMLRAAPPRFAVWDDGALRVDGIPDELVFGPELLAWLDATYSEERRVGEVSILRRRDGPR
jgi:hypothetical protein